MWNDFLSLCQQGEFTDLTGIEINCCVLTCMEYVTDRDFPNQYADGVNLGLCDTRDNTFRFSKEQLKAPCDNFGNFY